jgi:hypothetical protein
MSKMPTCRFTDIQKQMIHESLERALRKGDRHLEAGISDSDYLMVVNIYTKEDRESMSKVHMVQSPF